MKQPRIRSIGATFASTDEPPRSCVSPRPGFFYWEEKEQAGAELCQALVKLRVIVYIGVEVEVEILVEV